MTESPEIARLLHGSRYELVSELGRGGMGVVLEVKDTERGDHCALKLIHHAHSADAQLVDRMRLEGETLAKVGTPHFVGFRGAGTLPDGSRFYAMDKLAGRTVRDDIRKGPRALRETLAIGVQLLDGLAEAHRLGVVHRDIKPENLFLTGDSIPPLLRILDFGIAKVVSPSASGPQPLAVPTAAGLLVGSLRWTSPEAIAGTGVDESSDLYSSGLVLWAIAAGSIVWLDAATQDALVIAQIRSPLPSLAERMGSPEYAPLDELLAAMTKKDKAARMRSATTAAAALRQMLRERFGCELRPLRVGDVPRLDPAAGPSTDRDAVKPAPKPARAVVSAITFPTLPPGHLFEQRYRIVEHLGSGGMGTVYRATQIFMKRDVAIKLIPLEARLVSVDVGEQFALETQALAALNHPNVVKIFDGGIAAGNMAYIAMELVPGRSLRSSLHSSVPLPDQKVCGYLGQVARGLMALHSVPILHRDIKPENVIVLPDGETKIVDLGLARVRTASKYKTRNPGAGGTVHYMPREQLMNEGIDESVDTFAFGLMMFECFVGVHPRSTLSGRFQNAHEAIASVVDGRPLEPLSERRPDLPKSVTDLYAQCTSSDPAKRPTALRIVEVFTEFMVQLEGRAKKKASAVQAEAAPPTRKVEVDEGEATVPDQIAPVGARGTVRMEGPQQAPAPTRSPLPASVDSGTSFARSPMAPRVAPLELPREASSPRLVTVDEPPRATPAVRRRGGASSLLGKLVIGVLIAVLALLLLEFFRPGTIL